MQGKEFKQWRENSRLSLRDVQSMTGVPISTISRFENGHSIKLPSYEALLSLARGGESPQEDKQAKIRWHIKQLEILIEIED